MACIRSGSRLALNFGLGRFGDRFVLILPHTDAAGMKIIMERVRDHLAATTFEVDGRPAFSAKLPESVMRLQRREYFRLSLPVTRPLKCSLTFTPKEGKPTKMECLVADVSGGGLGLVGLPADLPIELGLVLTDVKMDLPEVGMISGRLQVCSVIQSTNRLGIATKRAGCEFVNLPGPMMTLLQRYIIKIERERKARESGM